MTANRTDIATLMREVQRRAHDEAPSVPPATVQPTAYSVNCIPKDDINHSSYAVEVRYRGHNQWAVVRHGSCLSIDGTWGYESIPTNRTDEWLARHRFDRDTALRLAREAAPLVTVNGYTVADVLRARERRAASSDTRRPECGAEAGQPDHLQL